MGGRQPNGWGNCVWCGEMLLPEDAEPWADRCPFCLAWLKIKRITGERLQYIKKKVKEVTTEERKAEHGETGEVYWVGQLAIYEAIKASLLEILRRKKENSYDTSWPTKIKPLPINEVTFIWKNTDGLEMKNVYSIGDKLETKWQKGENAFTLEEIKT